MEVGHLDRLSGDKGEVLGMIFDLAISLQVSEVLHVIGDAANPSSVTFGGWYSAAVHNQVEGDIVGDLSYDPIMDEVVMRLRESNCGCDIPYIVSSGDLYDLAVYGKGKVIIREEM